MKVPFKDRIKAAWRIVREGFPSPRFYQQYKQSLPFAWPAWRQGVPEWHLINLQDYIDEGFCLNSLVYSAIMFKVRAVVPAPLRAYTGDPEFPEMQHPDHPISRLLERPNEHQSWAEFQSQNLVYFNLDGNVFILKSRRAKEMYSLRPDRVFIIPSKGKPATVMGYKYVPEGMSWEEGVLILPEDMMHIKLPYPGDQLEGMGYGLAPLSPAAKVTDLDNMVTDFLNLFFKKGSMLTGVLRFDVPLREETVDEIMDRWKKKYGGYEKWEIGVLDRGGTYERLGLTFEEMGFKEIDARSETRILGPFGVPPILIGSKVGLDRSTYSNYDAARKAVWEDTLVPELKWFEAEYSYHIKGRRTFVRFDFSDVPALQKDVPIQANAAFTLWQMGVPAHRALRAVGLKLGRFQGGDEPYAGKEKEPLSNAQGPRADDETDSWGMRSLELRCDNCGGPLESKSPVPTNGNPPELVCRYCRQPYVLLPEYERYALTEG